MYKAIRDVIFNLIFSKYTVFATSIFKFYFFSILKLGSSVMF